MTVGPGKGNHRTGPVRGTKSGKRRGTLPAHRDPIIIGRRALAAPLWLAGNDGTTVQNKVNTWLTEQGELPVSLDTVRRDKREIEAQWREDGADSISGARALHIARLERLMSRLWVLFDRAEAERVNCVPIADQIRKLESDIGTFDASLAASKLHVTNEDKSFEERVKMLLAVKPEGERRVIPLLEDGEFATSREPPPPVRGNS